MFDKFEIVQNTAKKLDYVSNKEINGNSKTSENVKRSKKVKVRLAKVRESQYNKAIKQRGVELKCE